MFLFSKTSLANVYKQNFAYEYTEEDEEKDFWFLFVASIWWSFGPIHVKSACRRGKNTLAKMQSWNHYYHLTMI